MHKRFYAAALAALSFACGTAMAQQPAPQQAQPADPATATAATAPAKDAEERLVCRRIKPIGSNRAERICKTASQWRQEQDAAVRDGNMANDPMLRNRGQ
jgi:hypothetical protein